MKRSHDGQFLTTIDSINATTTDITKILPPYGLSLMDVDERLIMRVGGRPWSSNG